MRFEKSFANSYGLVSAVRRVFAYPRRIYSARACRIVGTFRVTRADRRADANTCANRHPDA
jgi:hypothetical protein